MVGANIVAMIVLIAVVVIVEMVAEVRVATLMRQVTTQREQLTKLADLLEQQAKAAAMSSQAHLDLATGHRSLQTHVHDLTRAHNACVMALNQLMYAYMHDLPLDEPSQPSRKVH